MRRWSQLVGKGRPVTMTPMLAAASSCAIYKATSLAQPSSENLWRGRSERDEVPTDTYSVSLSRAVKDEARARAICVPDLFLEADESGHDVELIDGDDDWNFALGSFGPVAGSVWCLAKQKLTQIGHLDGDWLGCGVTNRHMKCDDLLQDGMRGERVGSASIKGE